MAKRRVGIIGCGHILARHLESIDKNAKDFELAALCDIDEKVLKEAVEEGKKVPLSDDSGPETFTDYKEMLKEMKDKMNFVVVATPNHLHYEMAMDALDAGYDILVEKPIAFEAEKVEEIQKKADELGREAYCVLQVRFNPTVTLMRNALDEGMLGDVRAVTLTQRWQRPLGYFQDWRGKLEEGGKSLYEYTIHYLDIVHQLFGLPKIHHTKTFNHKHMEIPFEDTLYSIVEYGNGASGSIEVNVAVEPHNLECSLEIIGSKGFLHIGGNALDDVTEAEFENADDMKKWRDMERKVGKALTPNSYGTHVGSCPNHPTLYEKIAEGEGFPVSDAAASIKFIEDVYAKEE